MTIPLPVIADTFRCALKWVCGGQSAINVIHIRCNTSGQTAAQAGAALLGAMPLHCWESAASIAVIPSFDVTPLDGTSATLTLGTGSGTHWTGATTGNWSPAVAAIVKLQTNLRGRDNRGRVFIPFTAEAAQNDGALAGSLPGTMTTAWVALENALVALTPEYSLVVASYDRAHSGAGAHATDVDNITVEGMVGTQRRRQGRLR